jgi:hypothetical protein
MYISDAIENGAKIILSEDLALLFQNHPLLVMKKFCNC